MESTGMLGITKRYCRSWIHGALFIPWWLASANSYLAMSTTPHFGDCSKPFPICHAEKAHTFAAAPDAEFFVPFLSFWCHIKFDNAPESALNPKSGSIGGLCKLMKFTKCAGFWSTLPLVILSAGLGCREDILALLKGGNQVIWSNANSTSMSCESQFRPGEY